jgi:hypothetical protein
MNRHSFRRSLVHIERANSRRNQSAIGPPLGDTCGQDSAKPSSEKEAKSRKQTGCELTFYILNKG